MTRSSLLAAILFLAAFGTSCARSGGVEASQNVTTETPTVAVVKATLNEIECSIAIQNEGFQNLVLGSNVTLDEVLQKAPSNWYLEAQEAKNLGLVEAVL